MTATAWLLSAASVAFFAGAFLWVGLFAVAAWRDPKGGEIHALDLNRQLAATGRIFRAAAAFRVARLATLALALSAAGFLAAGALALAAAFAVRP